MIKKRNQVNKKIVNATETLAFNIKFKSKLESYVYKELLNSKLNFEYEGIKYTLINAFEFQGKKYKAITLTPDFVGDNFIIEAKGYPNDVFPYKWKLFLKHLKDCGLENKYKLFIVHNQKETKTAINEILNEKNR